MTETRARVSRSLALLVSLPLATAPAVAIDWRVTKGVGASATYSDTGGAADDVDAPPGGESVLAVSPFVRIDANGRRSELSATGQFELRRFVEAERDEFAPEVALASRTTLVDRLLDVDASARVSQQSAGADPLVGESLPRFGETEEVYEIGFGPTLGSRLGDRALYEANYRFAASRSSGDDLVGSDAHGVSARLLGQVREDVILIGGGSHDLVRFEGGQESTATLLGVGAGYLFRSTLLGFVTGGRDRVETGEASGAGDGALAGEGVVESGFWGVGVRWRPAPRLDVELGYGERAYGRRPSASVTLTGRRSTIELAWSRSLAFAAVGGREDLLLPFGAGVGGGPVTGGSDDGANGGDSSTPGIGDGIGDGIADGGEGLSDGAGPGVGPSGEGVAGGGLIGDGPSLAPLGRDAGSVDEVVDLSYSLRGRRSTLSASIGWARRERLEDVADEGSAVSEGLEYGLGFQRALSRRSTASAAWTATENDVSDGRDRSRENRFQLSISVAL